jgi:hypothetical protein
METGRMAPLPDEDAATSQERKSHKPHPRKAPRSERGDAAHAHRKRPLQAEPIGLPALNDCARDGPSREIKKPSVHAVDVTRHRMTPRAVADGEEAKGMTRKKTLLKPLLLDEDGCETASRSPPTMNIPTDKQPRNPLVVTLGPLKRPRCR